MLIPVILSVVLINPPLDWEKSPSYSQTKKCFQDSQIKRSKVMIGLLSGSSASFIVSLLIFSLARTESQNPRKVCVKGKPCGDSCIPVDYICHKNNVTEEPLSLTREGKIAAGTFLGIGVLLLIGGLVIPRKLNNKKFDCNMSNCSLTFKF